MAKRKRSIAKKISIIIWLMIFISTIAVGILGYVLYRSDTLTAGAERALSIAQTVAAGIDAGPFREVMETGAPNEDWDRAKTFVDKTIVETGATYLYVLGSAYDDTVTYYAEGYDPASGEEEYTLGDQEDASYFADEMYASLQNGQPSVTDAYPSGDFGTMVSGFAPILDSTGRAVGIVGVDLILDNVLAQANSFGLRTLLIVLFTSVSLGLFSNWLLNRIIGKPILALTQASQKIAQGDIDVSLSINSQDEIGLLAESFQEMVASTREQALSLEQVAKGNLTVQVPKRSQSDLMNEALQQTVDNLNDMFQEINNGTAQVSHSAQEIASGAQVLAQGAAEQAATVDQLADSIAGIAEKTEENAGMAEQTHELTDTIRTNAEKGVSQMEHMVTAVREIDQANQNIGKIIQVIEDIAAQTNILALNASVEAARAGEHGKGFAVVAEEVRSLAEKSAQSAQNTVAMVDTSLEKTALGVQIAGETETMFNQIMTGIAESETLIAGIAASSKEQSDAIHTVNQGIEQVRGVVQDTSSTAESSAAASQNMRTQAAILQSLTKRFQLKEIAGGETAHWTTQRNH